MTEKGNVPPVASLPTSIRPPCVMPVADMLDAAKVVACFPEIATVPPRPVDPFA